MQLSLVVIVSFFCVFVFFICIRINLYVIKLKNHHFLFSLCCFVTTYKNNALRHTLERCYFNAFA